MMDLVEFRAAIKKLLKRDTLAFKTVLDVPPAVLEKLSEKARSVHAEIVKNEFGCSRDSIRALASVLLEEELPPVKSDDKWLFERCGFIAIKMNIHAGNEFVKGGVFARLPGYKFDDRNCYKRAFITSKDVSSQAATFSKRSDFEFATDAEIDTYVDNFPENGLQRMMESVVFM